MPALAHDDDAPGAPQRPLVLRPAPVEKTLPALWSGFGLTGPSVLPLHPLGEGWDGGQRRLKLARCRPADLPINPYGVCFSAACPFSSLLSSGEKGQTGSAGPSQRNRAAEQLLAAGWTPGGRAGPATAAKREILLKSASSACPACAYSSYFNSKIQGFMQTPCKPVRAKMPWSLIAACLARRKCLVSGVRAQQAGRMANTFSARCPRMAAELGR